jgi:hypothetical protein
MPAINIPERKASIIKSLLLDSMTAATSNIESVLAQNEVNPTPQNNHMVV